MKLHCPKCDKDIEFDFNKSICCICFGCPNTGVDYFILLVDGLPHKISFGDKHFIYVWEVDRFYWEKEIKK